jgi:hypothetical protein
LLLLPVVLAKLQEVINVRVPRLLGMTQMARPDFSIGMAT